MICHNMNNNDFFKYVIEKYGNNYKLNYIIEGTYEQKGICNIDLEEYNNIFKTHCGHTFLYENLFKWYLKSNNCPYCRTELLTTLEICY